MQRGAKELQEALQKNKEAYCKAQQEKHSLVLLKAKLEASYVQDEYSESEKPEKVSKQYWIIYVNITIQNSFHAKTI